MAVCGSGPAGLSAAADLVRYGCEVTIYEALHVVGGVLQYGIPSFRLPRDIISREVKRLSDMGVRFETNKVIGKTFTVPRLLSEKGFDAVFLAVGAGAPAFLGIPGEFAGQVYSANEFLTRVNLMGGNEFPFLDTPISLGKSVVVIGAGNTAMDCLRVAKRLGAPVVRCVYRRSEAEAPARVEEIRHAKEEGIEFFFLHAPVEIHTDAEGGVRGMKVEEMQLGEPDEKGRRKPVPTGRTRDLECDTVIYALGTKANPIVTQSTPGLSLSKWGNIAADDGRETSTQATSLPGVFAGGDIVTGGATVILAMGAGRRAARSIAAYLSGRKRWPVTAEDVAGFQRRAAEAQAKAPAPAAAGPAAAPPAGATALGPEAQGKTCPRCRRSFEPGEPGEEYLCCGGQELRWRCQACGKVSEGFAFPYGMCPACGGKLKLAEATAANGAGSLEAIRRAFEIELGGMAFYAQAAREAGEPEMQELFHRFREMEKDHLSTLSRRYHVEIPAPTTAFPIDRAAVYAGISSRPGDPGDLFRLAIAFEERAAAYFQERVAVAPAGAPERALYQELAAEEREHAALLSTEHERWKRGRRGVIRGATCRARGARRSAIERARSTGHGRSRSDWSAQAEGLDLVVAVARDDAEAEPFVQPDVARLAGLQGAGATLLVRPRQPGVDELPCESLSPVGGVHAEDIEEPLAAVEQPAPVVALAVPEPHEPSGGRRAQREQCLDEPGPDHGAEAEAQVARAEPDRDPLELTRGRQHLAPEQPTADEEAHHPRQLHVPCADVGKETAEGRVLVKCPGQHRGAPRGVGRGETVEVRALGHARAQVGSALGFGEGALGAARGVGEGHGHPDRGVEAPRHRAGPGRFLEPGAVGRPHLPRHLDLQLQLRDPPRRR